MAALAGGKVERRSAMCISVVRVATSSEALLEALEAAVQCRIVQRQSLVRSVSRR